MLLKKLKILSNFYLPLKRIRHLDTYQHLCNSCHFHEPIKFECLIYKAGHKEIKEICTTQFSARDFLHPNYIYHPSVIQKGKD